MSEELWLPVVGYEGRYEVSNLGRVRNRHGKVFIGQDTPKGYFAVSLSGGTPYRQTFLIHRLVMDAFVGPRPHGLETNHKDGDKSNNCLENLEYVTHQENCQHRARVLGKRCLPILRGEQHPTRKLSLAQVHEIRVLLAEGTISQAKIARSYGIHQSAVSLIGSGKRWS